MEKWTYRGVSVKVPSTADIPQPYKLGGRRDHIVQEILDDMEPWASKEMSETVEGFEPMPAIVVPVGAHRRIWAKHAGHRARNVQLSPFVCVRGELPVTTEFTLLMLGTPEAPMLVRAYPGDEMPPLPWQRLRSGEGEQSLAFWRQHAYVYARMRVILGTECSKAPEWF